MENILVACSNGMALLPIYYTWQQNDIKTCLVLIYVAMASFLSHLVENHKHDMSGIGYSEQFSYMLNRLLKLV